MRYWGELKHVGRYLYSILVLGKGKSLSPKRICCFPLDSQTRWHALVPLCPLLMITLQGWLPPEPVRWQISGVFWTGPITMALYLLRRGQSNSCLVELCSWKFLRSSPEQMTLWMCTWLVIVACMSSLINANPQLIRSLVARGQQQQQKRYLRCIPLIGSERSSGECNLIRVQ